MFNMRNFLQNIFNKNIDLEYYESKHYLEPIEETNRNTVLIPNNWTKKTIMSDIVESRVQLFAFNWEENDITYWFPFLIYKPIQLKQSSGYVDISTKALQKFGEDNEDNIEQLALKYAKALNLKGYNITEINITSNNNQHTHPGMSSFSSIDFIQNGPLKFSKIDTEYFALLYCFRTKKYLNGAVCKRKNSKWTYENIKIEPIDIEINSISEKKVKC